MDAVLGATKPANVLQVGGNDGTNAYGIPLASGGGSVVVSGTLTGATTNTITNVAAVVNAANSTASALNAGQNFTGTSVDLVSTMYTAIQVQLLTDQNGTVQLQFSTDNSNWDHTVAGPVTANESTSISTGIHGRYVRVKMTNTSASNQTFLRLQTLLIPIPGQPTIKDLDTAISDDDNAMVVHSVISGISRPAGDSFTDVEVSSSGALQITTEGSVLGDTVVTARRNQIELNFSSSDASNATLITNTTSGTGAITQANGEALYSTGTGAAGQAKGVTVQSILYRPANDIYAEFTAAFTTPTDSTVANDHQRVGIYDTNNGLYLGYEGTTFGISVRLATVDTQTSMANFNLDPLNGSPDSGFTRAGVPEAVDFTKLNLYRIRFAWFGAGPVYFDIFTPDGAWLPFHIIRNPNLSNIPYIATPNLPITIDAFKTSSDGTNLQLRLGCAAAGVTESAVRLSDPVIDSTLVTPVRAIIAGKLPSGSYSNVSLTPDSALQVGGSGDAQINAATWTSTTGSAIAYVGGATNNETGGATTLTTTYTATAGNIVIATFNTGAGYTGLTVKDNHGNSLTAGPTIGQLASFYYTVPAGGATSFVAAWTTSRQASLIVAEYSGVDAVNAALAGNTNSGTSATASITVTPDEAGDFIVAALSNQVPVTMTGSVGNTRQNVPGPVTAPQILMDTTGGTCSATLTSNAWDAVAIGLRPTLISGTALNTTQVMVNNTFAYNSVTVELVGTGTFLAGAITFEVSIDNVNWSGLLGTNVTTGLTMPTAVFTLTSGTTCLSFNNTGFQYMRARLSTQIAGYLGQVVISYTVQGLASPNVNSNITTGSINVNGNQGTPNSIANSWPMEITDGTHGPAAVKAASTAAIATDTALVVAISPNNSPAVVGTLTNNNAAPAATNNLGVLPAVANAAIPGPWTEGDQVLLSTDLNGSLRIMSGTVPVVSETWASGSGGTSASISVVGYNTVIATLNGSGTILTGAWTAEVSDDGGTTWFSVLGRNINTSSAASSVSLTALLSSWQFNVAGYTTFRMRNSTTITGSGGQSIVRVQASNAVSNAQLSASVIQGTASNLNALVAQGSAAAATAPWYTTPGVPTTGQTTLTNNVTASSGWTSIIAGSGTKTVRLWRFILIPAAATSISLGDGTNTFLGPYPLLANQPFTLSISGEPWCISGAGAALEVNNSNAVSIAYSAWTTQS